MRAGSILSVSEKYVRTLKEAFDRLHTWNTESKGKIRPYGDVYSTFGLH